MNERHDLARGPGNPHDGRRVKALVILEVEPGKFLQMQLNCRDASYSCDTEYEEPIFSGGPTRQARRTIRIELEGSPLAETYVDRPSWAEEPQGEIGARRELPPGPDPQAGWPAHLRDDAPRQRCSGCGRLTVATSEFGQPCRMPQPSGQRCTGVFTPQDPAK